MIVEVDVAPIAYEQVKGEWLPGRRPYGYQWEAYQQMKAVLEEHRTVCLFLVTPTGSGKTLASYAYSVLHGKPAIGVYPTNELMADQERAFEPEYETARGWSNWAMKVDSHRLDLWQANLDLKRHGETLEALLNWQRVVLTNPDILYYIAFGRYPALPGLRERLFRLLAEYPIFVFDEFHLYNVKQVANVAFLIGALRAIQPSRGRAFIFASATPQPLFRSLLEERLAIQVQTLEAGPSNAPDVRTIAHAIRLVIVSADLERWQGPTTLAETIQIVDSFRHEYPAGRFVAIFDAVAAAIGVAHFLRERYPGLEVGEVHGLSSAAAREAATRCQATVGTATIEVGIDFKGEREKDFLIFEARTAGQFIQRLGRIARHKKHLPIPNLALALVPSYVCQFLAKRLPQDSPVTRHELYSLVEEAYEQPEEFQGYLHRHASVEIHEAISFIRPMFQPDDRPQKSKALEALIPRITDDSPGRAAGKHRRYQEAGILAPLLTFRGGEFEAAILDMRRDDPGIPGKRYSLLFILRRGLFDELAEETFLSEVEALARNRPDWVEEATLAQRYLKRIEAKEDALLGVYGHFRLQGLLDKARHVWFELGQDQIWGHKGEVTIISELSVCVDPPAPTRQLNRFLQRKRIVAWFLDVHPAAVRLGRGLPALFPVHELRVVLPGGGTIKQPWSIAFNQAAFFLSSLEWKLSKENETFVV
ncbi:MAG TPA: type I-D CRISPR-associated helicase Cas3' [Alphaproteobacteria bacterium]|nr:type I-D CRISPR-associated helicase Cas3' [Alphaproteobacteria bacterium]